MGEVLKAASQQIVHATDNPHEMDPADEQSPGKEGYIKQLSHRTSWLSTCDPPVKILKQLLIQNGEACLYEGAKCIDSYSPDFWIAHDQQAG